MDLPKNRITRRGCGAGLAWLLAIAICIGFLYLMYEIILLVITLYNVHHND